MLMSILEWGHGKVGGGGLGVGRKTALSNIIE